ncbi:major facilitator superfamily domain-containing protein [Xylariales sp. PMI_506]|nr:major facilitator superfamily domain-containing protein [Xylariales sp. PMI_506]
MSEHRDHGSRHGDFAANESSPLLATGSNPRRQKISAIWTSSHSIVIMLCLATFVAASAVGFTIMPLTRIIEDILCRQHYGKGSDDPLDEQLCKVDQVQTKLAVVIAVSGAIEAIMGCIGALPWSIAADRIGRKAVIVLALIGIALNLFCAMTILWFWEVFPLQLVWISGLFQLLGGGQAIVAGGVLSILTDLVAEEQRATVFLRMHIASFFGNLGSPALASLLMAKAGPWPCLLVAVGLLLCGGLFFTVVPVSNQQNGKGRKKQSGQQQGGGSSSQSAKARSLQQLREGLSMLRSGSLILLLLISLTTSPVTLSVLAFMVQFVSKRYGVPIFATGYIQTGYGLANMVFALLVIPWLSRVVLRHVPGERDRDLLLAKWSYAFLILGAAVLGFAPSLPVFCLGLFLMAVGSGYNSLTRSLISFFIKPELRSRVFALVGMVEVVGNIYSQPLLAGLFSLGLQLGGGWIGLPYYGLALLLVFSLVLLFFVKVVQRAEEEDDDDSVAGDLPPPYHDREESA